MILVKTKAPTDLFLGLVDFQLLVSRNPLPYRFKFSTIKYDGKPYFPVHFFYNFQVIFYWVSFLQFLYLRLRSQNSLKDLNLWFEQKIALVYRTETIWFLMVCGWMVALLRPERGIICLPPGFLQVFAYLTLVRC